MTWEEELFALLDDLEQQAEALYDAERDVELADRSRAEYSHVSLASRLMASVGREVVLDLRATGPVGGVLERVGTDWCLVRGPAQDWVVRTACVMRVLGCVRALGARGRLVTGREARRWASALRRLAEPGERCVLHLLDGTRHEALLRRVGADFVEVAGGGGPARAGRVHRPRRGPEPGLTTPGQVASTSYGGQLAVARAGAGPAARRGLVASASSIASMMCLRTIVRGSRSRSSRSAYSGPSSSRSSSRAALAKLRSLADQLAGLAGELGQLVGAEHEHRDERDDRQLRQADPEHGSELSWSG